MSSEVAPGETTPLRTTGNIAVGINPNLNNNSVRIETRLPTSATTTTTTTRKMDNRKVLIKVAIDFSILLIVGFPILFFYLWGDPYKRGFFCDDNSLRHPFHESTVKNWMLYIFGLALPIAIIAVTEIIQSKFNRHNSTRSYRFQNWDIPPWVVQLYKQIGYFAFGAVVSQLATDIAKYTIGRLRPHFISVCQPVLPNGSNCSSPENIGKYIEDFKCIGHGSSPRMLKEMRLSFPSGHSSFSAYTMFYCAIYLHSRMTWEGSKLAKHFLQFLLVMLAWYTALSRISDYKHHWSDALSGLLLGTLCAVIVANFFSDLFDKKYGKYDSSLSRHELTSNINSTNGLA